MLKLFNTFGMDEIELYIEQVLVKPQLNPFFNNFTHLLIGKNNNVEELDYNCGLNSALIALTYGCIVNEDEKECEAQESNDQSKGAKDVQHDGHETFEFMDEEENNANIVSSFLALHEAIEK